MDWPPSGPRIFVMIIRCISVCPVAWTCITIQSSRGQTLRSRRYSTRTL
jgi:hypothetical protein